MSSVDGLIENKINILIDSDQIKVKPCQGCDPKILSQLIKKEIESKNNEYKAPNSPKKEKVQTNGLTQFNKFKKGESSLSTNA